MPSLLVVMHIVGFGGGMRLAADGGKSCTASARNRKEGFAEASLSFHGAHKSLRSSQARQITAESSSKLCWAFP